MSVSDIISYIPPKARKKCTRQFSLTRLRESIATAYWFCVAVCNCVSLNDQQMPRAVVVLFRVLLATVHGMPSMFVHRQTEHYRNA